MYLKLAEKCDAIHLNVRGYRRRLHGGNTSIVDFSQQMKNTSVVVTDSLKRLNSGFIANLASSEDSKLILRENSMIDLLKIKGIERRFSIINKGVISFQGGEIDIMPKLMQDLGFVNNQSKILSEIERRKGLDSTDSDLIASKSAQSIRHILNKSAKSSVASLITDCP